MIHTVLVEFIFGRWVILVGDENRLRTQAQIVYMCILQQPP